MFLARPFRLWRYMCALFVVTVVAWAIPAAATAATFYLSGGGSDSNPGTLEQPWRTIARADEEVAPGDTVYLRAGSYGLEQPSTRTELTRSGTVAAPISWLAYPGDPTPVFHGSMKVTGAFNRVSGLLFDGPSGPIGSSAQEVMVWLNARGDELDNSEVRDSAWHAGVFVSDAPGFSVRQNYIHGNGNDEQPTLDHGLYVSATSTGTIAGNLISDNYIYGVQLYPDVNGVTIEYNTIIGNGRGGVIIANESSDNLVRGNLVANNNEYGIFGYELTGTGNQAVDNLVWNQDLDTLGAGMTFTGTTVASPESAVASSFGVQAAAPTGETAAAPPAAEEEKEVGTSGPHTPGSISPELSETVPEPVPQSEPESEPAPAPESDPAPAPESELPAESSTEHPVWWHWCWGRWGAEHRTEAGGSNRSVGREGWRASAARG